MLITFDTNISHTAASSSADSMRNHVRGDHIEKKTTLLISLLSSANNIHLLDYLSKLSVGWDGCGKTAVAVDTVVTALVQYSY